MITLPTEKSKVQTYNPRLMVLFGKPKAGKSTLMAALDNALIIDLENGYRSLSAMIVQARSYADMREIAQLIANKIKEEKKFPYKYLVIDNATRLEEMCLAQAAVLYRQTPMGANWRLIRGADGKSYPDPTADVRSLPNGAGYGYLRTAVKTIIDMYKSLAETLILVAHVKDKQINMNGTEISEMSVDLAGKLGDIICGEADAIGLVYRDKNKTFISFSGGDNTVKEARPIHLRGKIFEVASSDENNNITVDLSKVFLN